jgi:hypothetical protein
MVNILAVLLLGKNLEVKQANDKRNRIFQIRVILRGF